MMRFFHVTLRTSDVEAARSFYGVVLGDGLLDVVKLHDQAVARGARPHWLGFLDVGDVDRAAAAFGERGATLLGPKWVNPKGLEAAMMRDPGGALVALAKPPPGRVPERARAGAKGADVVWHLLHTADVQRAKANYSELFGWEFGEVAHLGSLGTFHPFAWERGGDIVGAMSDLATRSAIHPHWLFHFQVAALDPAIAAVSSANGLVVDTVMLPTGQRITICDDPQGATFAICEASPTMSDLPESVKRKRI